VFNNLAEHESPGDTYALVVLVELLVLQVLVLAERARRGDIYVLILPVVLFAVLVQAEHARRGDTHALVL